MWKTRFSAPENARPSKASVSRRPALKRLTAIAGVMTVLAVIVRASTAIIEGTLAVLSAVAHTYASLDEAGLIDLIFGK